MSYNNPRLTCDFTRGCTYNPAGALALVVGINVPFITKIAKNVRTENNMLLWSDPTLISILLDARTAFRKNDSAREARLMGEAVKYCNGYLSEADRLPSNTVLRLLWAVHGYASITYVERDDGTAIDVVKSGPDTEIICAPANLNGADMIVQVNDPETVLVATGVERSR